MSVHQNMGRGELWYYGDSIRNERQVNQIALDEEGNVSFTATEGRTSELTNAITSFAAKRGGQEGQQWTKGRGGQWDSLHPAEGHEVKYCLSGNRLSILGKSGI